MTLQTTNRLVYVLIAPGFEEESTTAIVGCLRDAGNDVRLIGITPGAMPGQHGIVLSPDAAFTSLSAETPTMLIFPGGQRSVARLLIDPRLHRLADDTVAQGGFIVGVNEAFSAVASTLNAPDQDRAQLVRLDLDATAGYAQTLIGLLK